MLNLDKFRDTFSKDLLEVINDKKDFIHKMSIASKEARETKYWLRLLDKSNLTSILMLNYLIEIEHILNIITKIIKTSQEASLK